MEDLSVSAVTVNEKPFVYYFVYKTTNIVTKLIYVGKHLQHNTSAFDGYLGSGIKIVRAVKKYGKDNFIRETIEFCTSANVFEREIYWVDALSATNPLIGYNIDKGGNGGSFFKGRKHSEESKRKIGESNKGNKHWNYGKHHPTETKNKISESLKGNTIWLGRKHSEESKRKMSESQKGKPSGMKGKQHSEESKIKMSKGHNSKLSTFKGKHHSEETKTKMSIAKKGKPSWNKGKHPSEETLIKMSKSLKGKHASEETKKKMSESRKGKSHSEESKIKMSEAMKKVWAERKLKSEAQLVL